MSYVLVLNCGSSSIKFAVVNPVSGENALMGLVQCIGMKEASLQWKRAGQKQERALPDVNYESAIYSIIEVLREVDQLESQLIAVGHRVVHGGEKFKSSVVIDESVLDQIRDCCRLAPLHNPANLTGILAAKKNFPHLPQVAVFDTAFHQTMPKHAFIYAIPYELYTQHSIRRYGFHGTSHQYVAEQAALLINKPFDQCAFITAHLGNGSSVAAILNGKSVDTSMGFTPLEGLVMGTRSGDVDPSLHAFLADTLGYDVHKVTELLNKKSGVLGLSQLGSDMRTLENAEAEGHENAALAREVFCYRLAKYIMSYLVPLGRLDALIFTGGIGENDRKVRARVVQWLSALNFTLDPVRNQENGKQSGNVITTSESRVALVIPTNEELMIARDAAKLAQRR
ncbi:MAG: acetate kinase [Gammaproteobacteria bacterium GWF2_41_13]|nr:MAG: acetate kinase [Gammaproteobacteria bacterium GWF2_41_13]